MEEWWGIAGRAAVGMGIPMGIPMGMGVGSLRLIIKYLVDSDQWDGYGNGDEFPWGLCPVGILWGFLSGCDIKRKRVNYAINVTVDV